MKQVKDMFKANDNASVELKADTVKELYTLGIITKSNAVDNLWGYFNRENKLQKKVSIANAIMAIETSL